VQSARARGLLISLVPVFSAGLSSLTLAIILALTAGIDAGFLAFWAVSWAISLVLAWLLNGLLVAFRWPALLLIIPVVFYQVSLGGTQVPLAATPDWLQAVGNMVPFDDIGGILRTKIIGGQNMLPVAPTVAVAGLGLALIWLENLVWNKKARTVD